MTIADWGDCLQATIAVRPFVDRGRYGEPSYGTSTNYDGRVSFKRRFIRRADGSEVLARGEVWLNSTAAVTPEDELTLPDGSTPVILDVERPMDETGTVHHTKILFG